MVASWRCFLVTALLALCGCEERKDDSVIVFGTTGDYRPFEFYEDSKLTGFEIDLANAVADKLGKKTEFKDMPFSSLLAGLQNDTIDVVVASVTPSEDRRKNCDFTTEYYSSVMAFVHKQSDDGELYTGDLSGVKVACQLGTVPENWMKKNRPKAELVPIDNVVQAIELIKTGRIAGMLVDGIIASTVCKDHQDLVFTVVADLSGTEDCGSAMAVKKGSPLVKLLDKAIQELGDSGKLRAIKEKWNLISE